MTKNILICSSKRAKHIRLSILPSKKIKITFPIYISNKNYWLSKILEEKKNWIEKNLKKISQRKQIHLPNYKIVNFRKIKGKKLIEWAGQKIKKEVEKKAQKTKFKYKKIYIRSQKTIWGSCSSKKNLSFNYKIALLPKNLFQYIIAHELCHLDQPHHQKDFWQNLEKICPQAKTKREKLKLYCLE